MQAWESRLRTAARWLTVVLPILLIAGRAAADSALSLAALFFLIRCIATGDWSWVRRPWVRVTLGLWVWMLVISPFAYKIGVSFSQTLEWMRFILFAAAAEAWLLDEVWIRRLVIVTGAALLFTASDAILQYVTGHDMFGYPYRPNPTRLTGPFYPHAEPGIFMARLFFPAVLGAFALTAMHRRSSVQRIAVLAGAALIFAAIFLTGERAALILTVFGILLIMLLWQGLRRTLVFAAILGVLAGVLLAFKPPIVQRQFDSTATTVAAFWKSDYGHLWETGFMMGRAHPITGVGMNNFRYVCKEPQKHFPSCNLHPHNMYIQWFAESGIPGLLGFVLFVGTALTWLGRATLRSGRSGWVLGPTIAVLIQLWPFITTGGFFSNWNAVTFWLVLGWGLASARLYGGIPSPDSPRSRPLSTARPADG